MSLPTILAIIAGVLLIVHWKGPNAVWAGAALGAIVGLVLGIIRGDWVLVVGYTEANYGLLLISFAAGTFAGTVVEWVVRIARRLRSR
jgi:hypothetical protein